MATIIDGKEVAKYCKSQLREKVEALKEDGKEIGLAVIIVGNDSASAVYVKNKRKDCEEIGIFSAEYILPQCATQQQLVNLIEELNEDKKIDGILVQLPLPEHIDERAILESISPEKDVDAFHPQNVGKIMLGTHRFLPCTPAGIMDLLSYYKIDCEGKNCVIVGRSNIVGKPMALLMLQNNATVTVCHSKTANLEEITRKADILIVAVGKAKYITSDMVKDGAVVIDVGMNRDENNKLCGDVDFENVKEKCSFITPVPGGVGPMTRATLMKNTVNAAFYKFKN